MRPEIPIGTMTANQARAELRELKWLVEKIVGLIERDTFGAEGLLVKLKDRLDDWHRKDTISARHEMNWVESFVFYPAIRDGHSHLRIERGSRASRAWGDDLACLNRDFARWLLPKRYKVAFKG
jgi:hypothetical protein